MAENLLCWEALDASADTTEPAGYMSKSRESICTGLYWPIARQGANMSELIAVGTAVAQPGTIQYGRWEAFSFPTGTAEFLPVIIAQGKEGGPCIWLTAGIHGPEHAGPAVLYKLITEELVDRLRGTIVAIPALCPAGLRTMSYVPYHEAENPNRLWPDGRPSRAQDPDKAGAYRSGIGIWTAV